MMLGPVAFGDLLLRPDGTYAWITDDLQLAWPVMDAGQWTLDGTELLLRSDAGHETSGLLAGDTVVLDVVVAVTGTWEYLFRRSEMPDPPIASGTYVLTSVNGRSDLSVEHLNTHGRFVHRVLYDTLTFHEGLYFRQARAERFVTWPSYSAPDSTYSSRAWSGHGLYAGSGDTLILMDLGSRGVGNGKMVDTLAIGGAILTRRVPQLDPETGEIVSREEVYTRRR